MRFVIGVMASVFALQAIPSQASVVVVTTGNRARQERLLTQARAMEKHGSVVIKVCGAGMTMLYNRNIETNVLLERAKASGVKFRTCKRPDAADMVLLD